MKAEAEAMGAEEGGMETRESFVLHNKVRRNSYLAADIWRETLYVGDLSVVSRIFGVRSLFSRDFRSDRCRPMVSSSSSSTPTTPSYRS